MNAHARALSVFLALSVAVPLAFAETPAFAQVSDADRNAARDLYNEGWQLQQAGRYSEALDRYQRSIAVFPAPTTAFRVAQCKAALGKLVEAAEEFRAITNAALPANAPPAFQKAKQDAVAELQNLEPRIPKLRINVLPSGVSGLTVTIDGQSMPTALVGVARPVDPGTHKIVAQAPGYTPAQAQIDVREKQQPTPEVTLTLQPGGTTYQPGGGTTYQTYPGGGTTYGGGAYQGSPYGGGYSPYGTWIPPKPRPKGPKTALMVGIDGDLVVPFGVGRNAGSKNIDFLNNMGASAGAGVDVALRVARILYLGLEAQGDFFSAQALCATCTAPTGGYSISVGGVLGLMSNPEGAGIYGEIGAGARVINTGGVTYATGDFILGIGVQFKAGNFRFIPKADFYVGPNDGGYHGFFTLGIAGYFELPLSKPEPTPAAAPANEPTAAPAPAPTTPAY